MRGVSSDGFASSRPGIATRMIAGIVVIVIVIAAVAGYFLLKPGSTGPSGSGTVTTSTGCQIGSCATNPVSGVELYNDYQLSGIPTPDPAFDGKTVYAVGNLTSIITYPSPQPSFDNSQLETGVYTGSNDFEYWYWAANTTGFPQVASNQYATATCFVIGLAPYGNGSSFLYLDNCQLISLKS